MSLQPNSNRSFAVPVAVLLKYLPICISQETEKGPFRFSSQAVTCYEQSNHSTVETISLRERSNIT